MAIQVEACGLIHCAHHQGDTFAPFPARSLLPEQMRAARPAKTAKGMVGRGVPIDHIRTGQDIEVTGIDFGSSEIMT